ncbi:MULTISPECIES: hypothetical protein [unclassified Clostridium]|uniref:hypothetical protein n=1 Tax=unclassified Clostridium TaxID=2614128 RepID=UPI00029744C4|nr:MULTISPECIES: hypothetical protein [unclassified Clostridium]EKQ56198.1 MAG: hypothetical protein A370_02175 [Clostridium sp. Maddingley MBC34-26]
MIEEVNVIDIRTIESQELPSVLSSQFDKLAILETNVQKAVNMAVEAKKKAETAQVKMGLFDYSKKEAINLLQSASKGLAEGLMTATEAQKVSFEYQTKLTEITKFLFGLGVSNIAMNRSVVRELELKLKGASEEEISDLARQELKNVIIQLKAQEDIMSKQVALTSKVKKHQQQLESINRELDNIGQMDEQRDKKIATNTKSILENKATLEKQQQKYFEHDKQIEGLKKQDKEQDRLISSHSERLSEHDKFLKEHQQKYAEHNKKISDLKKHDGEQDNIIVSHSEKLLKHDKAFEEQQKKNNELEQETSDNTDKIKGLENSLKQQEQALTEKNSTLDKKYADTTKQLKDELSNLTYTTNKDSEIIKDNISSLLESVNAQISLVKEDLSKVEVDLSDEINSVKEKLVNTIVELKEEILNKDKEVYDKLTDLKDRIDRLDVKTSKLGWKIGIFVVATGSLILNILQICGIL